MAKKKSTKKTVKKTAKKPAKKVAKKTVSKKSAKTVKKTTKKAAKKTSKKTTQSNKKTKKDNLIHAPSEHVFWVCDGMVLKNLRDLANAFEHMTEEAYTHHANSERNDFAAWVRGILKEPKLAQALEKAKSKKEALKKVKTKLQRLK